MLCASCRVIALRRTVASSGARPPPRVAVVGGGVAGEKTPAPHLTPPPLPDSSPEPGLVAANELLRAGLHVTLYDQGTRTPGGRGLSHRLAASGAVYDHGAQFIRQPADAADRLGALVQEWVTAGAVLRWNARAGHLVGGRFTPSSSVATTTTASHFFADQLCGPQQPQLLAGTASLAQHLARPREGYTLRVNSRVSGLHRDARTGWLVTCATPDGDTQEQFDAVVVSAAQAARPSSPGYVALSGDLPGAVAGHWARIAAVSYLPVFTAMATLPSGCLLYTSDAADDYS
jgi:predicted NAD/FAD-dependent oxidoreductase